jgi:hypothetical protein
VNEFEKHVHSFVNTTDYPFTKTIGYPTPGYTSSGIGLWPMENDGWIIIRDADTTVVQANGTGQVVSVSFQFGPPTSIDFFVYENRSLTPSKTKVIF